MFSLRFDRRLLAVLQFFFLVDDLVARVHHRSPEAGEPHLVPVVFDRGLLGAKIDRCGFHSLQLLEFALDPRGTGGAVHPRDGQIHGQMFGVCFLFPIHYFRLGKGIPGALRNSGWLLLLSILTRKFANKAASSLDSGQPRRFFGNRWS